MAASEGIVHLEGLTEGYNTKTVCAFNTSADFGISFPSKNDKLYTWNIGGNLPNTVPGNAESYPSITWSSASTTGGPPLLAWAAYVNPNATNKNMIAITAGGLYNALNQTQCTVDFVPTAFDVSVNLTSQTIIVAPSSNVSTAMDLEPTSRLTNNAMWSLNLLSRMTTSLYESTLGNTLQKNIDTSIALTGGNPSENAILSAISDSFTAILDDILVAYGSSQLRIAKSSTSTPVSVTLPAVQIGQNTYIFAVAGINIALLILLLVEGVRTRFWDALPIFDYGNIKMVILAASAGGVGTMKQVTRKYEMVGTTWSGDFDSEKVDEVRVQLGGVNVKGGPGFEWTLRGLGGDEDAVRRQNFELNDRGKGLDP